MQARTFSDKNVQLFYVYLFLNCSRKFGAGDKVTYNGKDYLCKPCLVASELQKAQSPPRKVHHSGYSLLLEGTPVQKKSWNFVILLKNPRKDVENPGKTIMFKHCVPLFLEFIALYQWLAQSV